MSRECGAGHPVQPDSDSGEDSDTGTDTGPGQHVDCETEPLECIDIGATEEAQSYGCCHEGVVYWCQNGFLDSIDCATQGYSCEYAATGGAMDCV